MGAFITHDEEVRRLNKYWKALRIVLGFSAQDFAECIGRTRQSIWNLETGKAKFTIYDYFAFHGAYENIAYCIENTEFYIDFWNMMINGMDYHGNNLSEEEADALSKAIIDIANNPKICPRKLTMEERSKIIKDILFSDEGDQDEQQG